MAGQFPRQNARAAGMSSEKRRDARRRTGRSDISEAYSSCASNVSSENLSEAEEDPAEKAAARFHQHRRASAPAIPQEKIKHHTAFGSPEDVGSITSSRMWSDRHLKSMPKHGEDDCLLHDGEELHTGALSRHKQQVVRPGLKRFQQAVSKVVHDMRKRAEDGVTVRAVAIRAKNRFMTTYEHIDSAAEQEFISSVLRSLPVMLKETAWMKSIGDALRDLEQHGDHEEAMAVVSKVLHDLKTITARLCWAQHIDPLQDAHKQLDEHHTKLKEQFNSMRSSYLCEVTSLREQLRNRRGPGSADNADLAIFYDPMVSLTEEEFTFVAKVVKEKVRMIIEQSPGAQGPIGLQQLTSMESRAEGKEVRELKATLAQQIKANSELKEKMQSLQSAIATGSRNRSGFADVVSGASTNNMIAVLEAKIEDLRGQVKAQNPDKADLDTLRQERAELQRAYDDELAERMRLQNQLGQLTARAQKAEAEKDLACEERVKAECEASSANARVEEFAKELAKLKKAVQAAQAAQVRNRRSAVTQGAATDAKACGGGPDNGATGVFEADPAIELAESGHEIPLADEHGSGKKSGHVNSRLSILGNGCKKGSNKNNNSRASVKEDLAGCSDGITQMAGQLSKSTQGNPTEATTVDATGVLLHKEAAPSPSEKDSTDTRSVGLGGDVASNGDSGSESDSSSAGSWRSSSKDLAEKRAALEALCKASAATHQDLEACRLDSLPDDPAHLNRFAKLQQTAREQDFAMFLAHVGLEVAHWAGQARGASGGRAGQDVAATVVSKIQGHLKRLAHRVDSAATGYFQMVEAARHLKFQTLALVASFRASGTASKDPALGAEVDKLESSVAAQDLALRRLSCGAASQRVEQEQTRIRQENLERMLPALKLDPDHAARPESPAASSACLPAAPKHRPRTGEGAMDRCDSPEAAKPAVKSGNARRASFRAAQSLPSSGPVPPCELPAIGGFHLDTGERVTPRRRLCGGDVPGVVGEEALPKAKGQLRRGSISAGVGKKPALQTGMNLTLDTTGAFSADVRGPEAAVQAGALTSRRQSVGNATGVAGHVGASSALPGPAQGSHGTVVGNHCPAAGGHSHAMVQKQHCKSPL